MYASLSDLLRELFGIDIALPIQTFGLVMAISFAGAYVATRSELIRKEALGLLKAQRVNVWLNKKASLAEYALSILIGGLIGFKLLEAVVDYNSLVADPQAFILSSKGNLLGLLLGGVYGYYSVHTSDKKIGTKKPEQVEQEMRPHDHMGNILAIAAVAGLLGAKVFHNLENWDELVNDPIDALLSFSGLTFYGGLIVAAACILYYAYKKGINLKVLADSAAPGLMLAYAIGRLGCQLSGDGDWGVVNSAYKIDLNLKVVTAQPGDFEKDVLPHFNDYYLQEMGSSGVRSIYFKGPDMLPNWFWGFHYPHNVINNGVAMPDCSQQHCSMLPNPVFPTPLYEALICGLLFGLLWMLRRRFTVPGVFFCFYLLLNGLERFAIEKIRVNTTYSFLGIHPTQAEIISGLFVLLGLGGMWFFVRKKTASPLS